MPGVIVRQQIRERIANNDLIENTDLEKCLQPSSYELRVGSYLDSNLETVSLSEGELVAVAPGGFVLLGTLETVQMPLDLLGMLYLRSSFARRGFVSWFQGLVDPGYKGGLTIALHNLTEELAAITGHEQICHIVFEELSEKCDEGYKGPFGKGRAPEKAPSTGAVKVIGREIWAIGKPALDAVVRAGGQALVKGLEGT